MTDWIDLIAPIALSFSLIYPFVLVFRVNWLAFAAGATIVAALAYVLESISQFALGPLDGPLVVLVLLAPIIEELLKLLFSIVTGATYETAAGSGAGFAASENGLYFLAAWGSAPAVLAVLVAVRAFTDPVLHITTCTLTTSSWRGRTWALPAGILVHVGWNAMSLFIVTLSSGAGFLLIVASSLVVLGILATVRQSRSFRDALARRSARVPWAGARA